MTTRIITQDQFDDDFKPVQNTISANPSWGGLMFETSGPDYEYVLSVFKTNPDRVWTIVSDEVTSYTNGMHTVNRMGYLITEIGLNEHPDYQGVTFLEANDPDEDELNEAYDDEDEDEIGSAPVTAGI